MRLTHGIVNYLPRGEVTMPTNRADRMYRFPNIDGAGFYNFDTVNGVKVIPYIDGRQTVTYGAGFNPATTGIPLYGLSSSGTGDRNENRGVTKSDNVIYEGFEARAGDKDGIVFLQVWHRGITTLYRNGVNNSSPHGRLLHRFYYIDSPESGILGLNPYPTVPNPACTRAELDAIVPGVPDGSPNPCFNTVFAQYYWTMVSTQG